jgi:acetylornithine deacetylase/succinyl-diaminopimelate desuccinylase-like protein
MAQSAFRKRNLRATVLPNLRARATCTYKDSKSLNFSPLFRNRDPLRRSGDRNGSKRRSAARCAAALVCAGAALLASGPASGIWPFGGRSYPDPRTDLGGASSEILSQAIRIPTVSPQGNERPLAELFVRVALREGLEARVIETPPGDGSERAAAWARWAGTGKRRPIVLLSHLDVVPASIREWTVDPFGGVVGGGYVVGRGALDAKGVAVVHLFTLIELAARGKRLERDVIFLATPDEEAGGRRGAGFLVHEHRELLGNAEFLLTEGGGIRLGEPGAPNVWGVAVSQKSPCWLRVSARGRPGHSSTAPDDTAVDRLLAALDRSRRIETAVRAVPEVERMFAALAQIAPPEDRRGFADLDFALQWDPDFRARFLADRGRRALVQNTVAITVLQGSPRTNVVSAEAFAHLDVRLLPGEECDDFARRVRTAIATPDVSVEPFLSFGSRSSPIDTDLFRAIRRVAAERDPGAVVIPRVIAGFTDAHYFRDMGIVSYGFVPRWLPPAESQTIHGPNERISIENLERGVHTLVQILEELTASDDGAGSDAVRPASR